MSILATNAVLYQYLLIFINLVLFFVVVFQALKNGQNLRNKKKNYKSRIVLIIFGAILLVFSIILLFHHVPFAPSDEEWEEIFLATKITTPIQQATLDSLRHGIFYPLILNLFFKIFGVIPWVAVYLNSFFSIGSILLVFILTDLIFKRKDISLAAAIIYILTPANWLYWTILSGYPAMMSFFMLAITTFFVAGVVRKNPLCYFLSLSFLSIAANTKTEYFALIPVFLLLLYFFYYRNSSSRNKHLIFFGALMATIVLVILCFGKIDQPIQTGGDFCGSDSHRIVRGVSPALILTYKLDGIVQSVLGDRFGVSYLMQDVPNFFKLWFSSNFAFAWPFILIGLVCVGFKRHREFAIGLFFFLMMSLIYLVDCAVYSVRYAIALYGLIVPFAGVGFQKTYLWLSGLFRPNIRLLVQILIIACSILTAGLLLFYKVQDRNTYTYDGRYEYYIFDNMKELVDKNPVLKQATLVVPHKNEQAVAKILGIRALAIGDLFGSPKGISSIDDVFKDEGEAFFMEADTCHWNPVVEEVCQRLVSQYRLVPVYRIIDRQPAVLYSRNNLNY